MICHAILSLASLYHVLLLKYPKYRSCSISDTYIYQGQNSDCSLRFAPVSPEQGMKWISFLGLKPTFFKNGTSFSLHSSYLLKWQAYQDKFQLFQHEIILCFKKTNNKKHRHSITTSSVILCAENPINLSGLFVSPSQSPSTTWSCPFPLSPLLHKALSVLSMYFGLRAGDAAGDAVAAFKREIQAQRAGQTEQTGTEVTLKAFTSAVAPSPPASYIICYDFRLFLSLRVLPPSLLQQHSVTSAGWGSTTGHALFSETRLLVRGRFPQELTQFLTAQRALWQLSLSHCTGKLYPVTTRIWLGKD